jgi:Arc/MetJ-type ribon-helix-helix transcriptional regulator
MDRRLQVLIPADLDEELTRAAQRGRMSKGEWVRRALRESLRAAETQGASDRWTRLKSLNAPTADIDRMLGGIEAGRR